MKVVNLIDNKDECDDARDIINILYLKQRIKKLATENF